VKKQQTVVPLLGVIASEAKQSRKYKKFWTPSNDTALAAKGFVCNEHVKGKGFPGLLCFARNDAGGYGSMLLKRF
jgi:hypothetical protein